MVQLACQILIQSVSYRDAAYGDVFYIFILRYRVFIKYFLNSASSAASAGVWPAIVYTHWHRGETEKGQSPEYILKSSKKTQYLMNTLYEITEFFL